MSQSVITRAFIEWKAQQAIDNQPVELDEYVFAYVPGLDIEKPIPDTDGLPDEELIVHRQSVSKAGIVNANAVVYSVTLGAEAGDFNFNWIGLINKSSGTVAAIIHAPDQRKIKNSEGQQGNVLTRSILMEFNNAQQETEISVPAETWQIDFTARLAGMDERQRIENIDLYGAAAFFDDGFLVKLAGSKYSIAPGAGYVAGLRAELDKARDLTVESKPAKVWVDVAWTGSLVSVWQVDTLITVNDELSDYIADGQQHYVFAVAAIDAAGAVTDLRPKGSLADQESRHFLRKDQNLADLPDVSKARVVLELGDAALRDVGFGPENVAPGDVIPAGSLIIWTADWLPENHAWAWGQEFDMDTYKLTARALPSGFLPDMRGMVPKGVPDGREVLTIEQDANKRHSHEIKVASTDLGTKNTSSFDYGTRGTSGVGDHGHAGWTDEQGWHDHAAGPGAPGGRWGDYIAGTDNDGNYGRFRTDGGGNHAHNVGIGAGGAHSHSVELGPHSHPVPLGAHSHEATAAEEGAAENLVKNLGVNYIVRLA